MGSCFSVLPMFRRLAVVGSIAMVLMFTATPSFAQGEGVESSVTITGYRCPAGATAEAFEPADCEVTTFGFDVTITSNVGIAEPKTLSDATLAGSSYRLELGRAAEDSFGPADFGNWGIRVVTGDGFNNDYVIVGDAVVNNRNDRYEFRTTTSAPDAVLGIYIFLSSGANDTDPPLATSEPTGPDPDVTPTETENPPVVDEVTVSDPAPVDEGTGRFVLLVEGPCDGGTADDLGDVVADLGELVRPIAAPAGAASAIGVETTFALVEVTLDAVTAGDHAIVVLAGEEDGAAVVACGEVGGATDAQGAISIGLAEADASGFAGIAYLIPNGEGITVSLFVAEGLSGDVEEAA